MSAGLISLDAGADTIELHSSLSASLLPPLRVIRVLTTSASTARMMLSSTLLLGDSVFGGTGADTLLFTGSVVNSSIQAGSGNDSIVMAGTGMTGQHHRPWCRY